MENRLRCLHSLGMIILIINPSFCSDKKDDVTVPIVRHSIDHKAEAEGLRGELSRVRSYHEEKIKEEKCKTCIGFMTALGSCLGAVASLIYSVKKCS